MGVNFTPDHGCTRWKWTSLDPNVVTVGLPVCTLEGDSYVARVEVSALAEGMVKIVGSVDDQSRDCTFNIKLGAGDTSVDTTADSSADGVTDAEDGGADSADSAPEATVSDASVDTSYDFVLRDIATCSTIRNPVAASVSTLLPMATTCGSPSDLLAEDGKVVGLARTPQDAPVTVAGVAVTACMQLDFGQAYNVQRTLARWRSLPLCSARSRSTTSQRARATCSSVAAAGATGATTSRSTTSRSAPRSQRGQHEPHEAQAAFAASPRRAA